ncbi:hypothetical protein CR513_53143, partial [Mucuna pruriens]
MKHPTEDHSLIGIDFIDELVEECLQLDNSSEDSENFAEGIDLIGCLGSIIVEANNDEVHNLSSSEDENTYLVDLIKQRVESDSNPTRTNSIKRIRSQQPMAEIMSAHLVPSLTLVGQPDPKASNANSSSPPPPMELKPLPSHLKYAYLDTKQQLPIIIANNLHQKQHKKAIGWKLSDLLGINPSICMHRILMEEEAKPIRQ